MLETEVVKLLALCSANYRNWPEEGKKKATLELWHTMLEDMPFDVAKMAVKSHLSQSVFPPTIADIRTQAAKITEPNSIDAIQAWDLISQAIRKYGFYREDEALKSLPPDVANMARNFGFRELCYSENLDTLRAQFRMAWETMQKREKYNATLPADVREMIESSGIKMLNGGLK